MKKFKKGFIAFMLCVLVGSLIPAQAMAAPNFTYTQREVESLNKTFKNHGWVQKKNFSKNEKSLVLAIQTMLTELGYGDLVRDSIFGPATEKATINFQSKNGLLPDGIVGTDTWNKLINEYLSALKKNTSITTKTDDKKFENILYDIAHGYKGKDSTCCTSTSNPWCGYYVREVLSKTYAQCGFKAANYLPMNSLPGTISTATAFQSGKYGTYYGFTEWKYGSHYGKKTKNCNSYNPKVGDILLVETNSCKADGPDHLALVIKVSNSGKITTSEGNTGSPRRVNEFTYSKNKNGLWERSGLIVHGVCRPTF